MPTKDRTEEFMKLRNMKESKEKAPKHDKKLSNLMKDVKVVEENLLALKEAVDEVETNQKAMLTGENLNENKKKLEMAEKKARTAVASTSKALQKMTPEEEGDGDSESKHPLLCMKENHVKVLSRRYIEQMNRLSALQGDHMTKMKKIIRQQLEAVEADDIDKKMAKMEELEQEQVFVDNIHIEMEDAVRSLDMCKAREQDLLKMEGKIHTVRDMFAELHQQVKVQGEALDHIESNVEDAGQKVDAGNDQLVQARKSKKKALRCKIIIITVVVVFVVIIAIALAVQFG